MKKYIGTKVVSATPAIRKGGKVYLPTDEIPKTMEPVEEGYKVVYEDGYESWSPKEVFEKAYQCIKMECHLDGMSFGFGKEYHNMGEHQLLPCIEPQTKPTEDMETKENRNLSQDVANCDKPESKHLNLCELLQGHEGDEFYSIVAGKCKLKKINKEAGLPICIISDIAFEYLTKDGKIFNLYNARCVLFPSCELYEQYPLDPYTAWMKWKEEQKKPFICIHWGEMDADGDEEEDYTGNIYFRTPADRDKCIEEIKAIIEKYSKK